MRKQVTHVQTCAVHPAGSHCPPGCHHVLHPAPPPPDAVDPPLPSREEALAQLLGSGIPEEMASKMLDAEGSPYGESS